MPTGVESLRKPCHGCGMETTWTKAGENWVRHANGKYYLRAKVGGKVIRKYLKTKDLKIAKIKRNDMLAAERAVAVAKSPPSVRTIREALAAQSLGPFGQTVNRNSQDHAAGISGIIVENCLAIRSGNVARIKEAWVVRIPGVAPGDPVRPSHCAANWALA